MEVKITADQLEELLGKEIKDATIVVNKVETANPGTHDESVRVYGKMLLKNVLDFSFTATMPNNRTLAKIIG